MSNNSDLNLSVDDDELSDSEKGTKIDEDIYIPPAPKPVCSLENTGARLIITQIVNENFKSYAGKQILGPFHKCFTSIIGPNGSGKSNVIDSMLFVFGYRATKIRSKKVSVLLHNSDQHRNVNSCKVEVHFLQIIDKSDHEDNFEIVPGSEFIVSRTAFKDNSSFYTINNKKVQFKEVAKLLRSHGIDLDHNRFLILQGEVEQIAMMKPKAPSEHESGMLEFLEDIIGTSRYKEPLQKLDERVEQLNQQRSEKLNRVKMVDRERANLEGPKNEAIQYIKYTNDLTEVKNKLYQKYIHQLDEDIGTQQKKKNDMESEMSDVIEKLNLLAETKVTKSTEIKKLSNRIDVSTKEKEKLNDLFKKETSRDMSVQENMKLLSNKRKKTKELLNEENKKLLDLEAVPEKNEREIEELRRSEEKLLIQQVKEDAALKEVMASLQSETQDLQDQKISLQTEHVELKSIADNAKSAYEIAKSELDLYLSTEQKERTKLDQISNNYKNITKMLEDRRQKIDELKREIPVCAKELRDAQEDLKTTKEEEADVLNQLRMQRQEVAEAKTNHQANKSRGKVIDSLMQEKSKGTLPGIFGRLGDLGAIDQKYDVAVSTACGPLDNIVVDTVTTGERCIEFLKRENIGRATFIVLEKQERWRTNCNTRIDTPENVPRLFDLIQVKDDRLRTAFYFALRDTLVANDLEQATRIAYGRQRHRVVTLKGELIEPSGTMSGGGKTVMCGRMGQSVMISSPISDRKLEQMQQTLDKLESRASDLRNRRVDLEEAVAKLIPKLKSMNVDLQKYEIDIQSQADQEPVLKQQLKEQENRVKQAASDPAHVKKLTKNVEETKEKYDKDAAIANEVDVKVKNLHKRIIDLTEGRMKAAEKKLDDINKKIDKVRQDSTKLKVAIKTAERNAKKSREKISNMEQDIEEAEKKLLDLKKEKEEIEVEAKDLLKRIETECTKIMELTEEMDTLKEEVKELSKEETNIKTSKIEFDQKVQNISKLISELKDRKHGTEKELNKLHLEEIPDEKDNHVLKPLTSEELDSIDERKLQVQVTTMESNMPKKPNLDVIKEYKEKNLIYLKRAEELEEVTENRNKMRTVYDELRGRRVSEFMGGFKIITEKLKEMYQMITLGGDAELELVDSLDPFTEGIVFSVRPPKKSWKNITNLSGGEKTLSSLALVFALHYYKPTPLYVMDEIDAALDFKNVSIVANYIKQRTKNAQFIIISLRSNMFELADFLVGIYKTYNCTKSVTLNPKFYASPADQDQGQSQPSQDTQKSRKLPANGTSCGNVISSHLSEIVEGSQQNTCKNYDVITAEERNSHIEEIQGSAKTPVSRKSRISVSFAMDMLDDSNDLM